MNKEEVQDAIMELMERDRLAEIDRISALAREMKAGAPGTCSVCEEDHPRIVGGACVPCRDKRERRNGQ